MSEHKTHTALARALNVSATAIRNWQREYDDAPKAWIEAEWRDFIDRHGLGQAGPRKSRRREELLVEKLASEVRLNQIKIAQAEAERLAAKEPGECFEILQCIAITRCTEASTFWMDGEEPPEKPRWRMLEVGEYCQDGDEMQAGIDSAEWVPRQHRGKQLPGMLPTRRPL